MASKGNWNRRLALGGGAALILGGGFLASRGKEARIPPQAGTLHRGNVAEPFTIDPQMVDAAWEDPIVGDMIMGLTTEDAHARPLPGMAESWQASPDGLTWTFKIREASWSDGVPFTADDFVFSWRRI